MSRGAGIRVPSRRAPGSTVSTISAGRFAARARAVRRVARRPLILAVLVVVLMVGAGGAASWALLWSDLLLVRSVVVEGGRRTPEDRVRDIAGQFAGVPLARVHPDEVAARVAVLAPVAEVRVERRWPHTLGIVVTERTPFAAIPDGSGYLVVDRSGVGFETSESRPRGLPVLAADLGEDGRAARAAGLEVIAGLPPALAARVVRVSAATPESVTLLLSGGKRVIWGSPDAAARKAFVLEALLRRPAAVYDVSAPNAPTTRTAALGPA